MSEFGYDEAVAALRGALEEARAQAQAFGVRSRGRPEQLSAAGWAELAQIEAITAHVLEQTLLRELRVDALPWWRQTRASARALWWGLTSETALLRSVLERTRDHPVARWRAAAPQLEAALWPHFEDRVHYLANTSALALNEPSPYPALVWQPQRQRFQR